jgi:hypothetical protein
MANATSADLRLLAPVCLTISVARSRRPALENAFGQLKVSSFPTTVQRLGSLAVLPISAELSYG